MATEAMKAIEVMQCRYKHCTYLVTPCSNEKIEWQKETERNKKVYGEINELSRAGFSKITLFGFFPVKGTL